MKKLFSVFISVLLFIISLCVPTTYAAEKKLISTFPQAGYEYDNSVSISGDYVIVGELRSFSGAAYIYYRNQGGIDNWGEVRRLTASDAQASDDFGLTVSISGDYAIVGAWSQDNGVVGRQKMRCSFQVLAC